MPTVHIHLIEGRSVDQKRNLVKEVTEAICRTVNTTPDHVKIILHDMARHDYANAGVLHIDQQN